MTVAPLPSAPHRESLPPGADLIIVIATAIVASFLYSAYSSHFVLDIDVVNLALSIEHFDIRQHQPHPPGYLGYVLILRAVHALTRLDLLTVARTTSRLFSILTLVFTWRAARRLLPESQGPALWAVALTVTSPFLLYYGIDGQTHSAEAALAAALLWLLAIALEQARPSIPLLIGIGLLVAAGGSIRPTYVLLAAVPIAWLLRHQVKRLLLVGVVAALGTAAWLIPTIHLTGGVDAFREANEALVGFIMHVTSPLSSGHNPRRMTRNLLWVSSWSAIIGLPVAIGWLLRRGMGRPLTPRSRHALQLMLLTATPTILFYSLAFASEPGYLAGLVPVTSVCAACLAAELRRAGRRTGIFPAIVMSGQLALFLLAPAEPGGITLPVAAQVGLREVTSRILYEAIHTGIRDADRVLVVSDYPNLTQLRQIPILRSRTDCLFLHSQERTGLPVSTISYATAHGWRAAPGDALLADGIHTTLMADVPYDWIVLDPRSSPELVEMLREQTTCTLADSIDGTDAPHLPASTCFPASVIRLGKYHFILAAHG